MLWFAIAVPAGALTPSSPEVLKLVEAGLTTLEDLPRDKRLGARCLSALAFMKAGQPTHPRVGESVSECISIVSQPDEFQKLDNYSFGLAMILLCEDRSRDHAPVLKKYLEEAERRQKDHGGWGYAYSADGDTSQTQYLALAMWAAHARGLKIDSQSHNGLANWLLNTQDPSGGWGYQGQIGSFDNRRKQTKVTCTLTAAAASSLMIAADMSGKLRGEGSRRPRRGADDKLGAEEEVGGFDPDKLPPGVTISGAASGQVQALDVKGKRRVSGSAINWTNVFDSIDEGDAWMESNFELPAREYPIYYLYTLERYESFREYRSGVSDPSPEWYRLGYEYLLSSQRGSAQWNAGCKAEADTSFAILFLLRSTQKSIRVGIGEGLLTSGRGLPSRTSGARLVEGRIVPRVGDTDVDGLMEMIEGDQAALLDAMANDPQAIDLSSLSESDVRRLKQLLRGEDPDARVVAARALGRLGQLGASPDLIYALTDPERRAAVAARDGLRAISRRSQGFGLPDDFDEDERFAVIERWKSWYLALEPDALLD